MKRRLNIFCVIMFLLLGYLVYLNTYQLSLTLTSEFNDTTEMSDINELGVNAMFQNDCRVVEVIPNFSTWQPDSLLNVKTGHQIPVMHLRFVACVNENVSNNKLIVNAISHLLSFFALVASMFLFIKLIININKSYIFEWKNVRYLRVLGVLLLFSFIFDLLPRWFDYSGLTEHLALRDYTIAPFDPYMSNLLLSIICFIVAEVFAIGLRFKEDQELTI